MSTKACSSADIIDTWPICAMRSAAPLLKGYVAKVK